jgi:hypothetical protein
VGERYRLRFRTLAVSGDDNEETLVEIPAGSEVIAMEEIPKDSRDIRRQIKIECLGRILRIFAIDLRIRGRKIGATSVEGQPPSKNLA